VEYDGAYFHEGHEQRDLEKNEHFAAQGIQVLRIREHPLTRLGEADLVIQSDSLAKPDVDTLLKSISLKCDPTDQEAIRIYIGKTEFSGDTLFNRLLSFYPGPPPEDSIRTTHPGLVMEWNWGRNGESTPDLFTFGSHHTVWWLCQKDHEWKAAIKSRTAGRGCPYCSNLRPGSDNNLAVINPTLAGQWHPTKNGSLTPNDIIPGSNRKAWWVCEKHHEWEASINDRNIGGGCPYCSNRKVGSDNNLAVLNPALAAEWHAVKNGKLTPYDITRGSGKKIWWKCHIGHEWDAIVADRNNGSGCPFCSNLRTGSNNNLAVINPTLAGQWHPTKNRSLTPKDVTPGSGRKAWWVCEKNHEWEASIKSRNRGIGCPLCSNKKVGPDNNLAVLNPVLAAEWHQTKNEDLMPQHVVPGSGKAVWWQCKNGHSWRAQIIKRNLGSSCSFCRKLGLARR
jgi:hypothetical protein